MKKHVWQWGFRMAKLCIRPVAWIASAAAALSSAARTEAQVVPSAEGAGTTVAESGEQYDIAGGTQAGGNLFHEFDEFSLSEDQVANFTSNSGVFNIVGQVSEANPSYIDGTVQVSGGDANLYLVNPAGMLFGPNARLSLSGSFTATTADQVGFGAEVLDVFDDGQAYTDLTADPSALTFSQDTAGAVVNQGELTVATGESLSLVGGSVVNTGRIEAPGGEVGLVAVGGNRTVKLAMPGSLLSMEVEAAAVELPLVNGSISEESPFEATDLPQLLTGSPVQSAQSLVVNVDGSVTLAGAESSAIVELGTTVVAGQISTRSVDGAGGTVALLGESVALVGAVVDASGDHGGNIRIGGDVSGQGTLMTADQTTVDSASVVQADGEVGAGGSVVTWADDTATVSGRLSAQGQTEGGFIETSAHTLNIEGIDANAGGVDAAGTWLVDPGEIEIVSGPAGANQISTATIESALNNNNNFEVKTDDSGTGDITLSASINQTNTASRAGLTFASRRFEDNGHKIDMAGTGLLQFLINTVNTETNQDGSSIQNALDAIGTVNGRSRLFIESGEYNFTSPVVIRKDVEISGDPAADTFLRATGNERLFNILSGNTVSFDHLTFSTEGLLVGETGGGIQNRGDLTVENSTFIDNRAADNGGAIDSFADSNLTVLDTAFVNNTAVSSGGAISAGNAESVTLDNVLFDGNSAGDDGGALRIASTITSVANSRFINNMAADDGGGAAVNGTGRTDFDSVTFDLNEATGSGGGFNGWNGATVTFENTTFSNNKAGETGGGLLLQQGTYELINSTVLLNGGIDTDTNLLSGGGIYTYNSLLTLDNTDVLRNSAERHGGGLLQVGGTVNILNGSMLEGNAALEQGGGLYATAGVLSVVDVDIHDNTADSGGGIFTRGTQSTTITTSELSENAASDDGGAIVVEDSSALTLDRVDLLENESGDQGGALFYESAGAVDAVRATFDGNRAASDGGAIAVQSSGSVLTLTDSTLQNNVTQEDGGAIFANREAAVVANATRLLNNRAEGTESNGGGLAALNGATVFLTEATVTDNSSQARGGGVFVNGSSLRGAESLVSGNQSGAGGGLFVQGSAQLTNTTLSGNSATDEGGAINAGTDSELTVRNGTITANQASEGGGIYAADAQLASLQNTIVAANAAAVVADVRGVFSDEGNNLIGQAERGSGFSASSLVGTAASPISPNLAPLADNGGPTKTHLLLANSAAIDAGASTNLPTVDQRGQVRFSGNGVDIGAVELTPSELGESVVEMFARLEPTLSSSGLADVEGMMLGRDMRSLSEDDVSIQQIERSFSQSYEDYWDLADGPDLTFSEVQAILQRAQEERAVNSAVVYAIFAPLEPAEETTTVLRIDPTPSGDDLLNLSVVMPEGELVSYQLPVTRREASRQIRLLRSSVSDPGDARGYRPFTQQLYQWLLAPIEKELAAQNIHNLMYALDAGLRTAPVAAMRDYEGYSLERYGISVVPSMGLMQVDFPAPVRRATVAMGVAEFANQPPLPAVPIELEVLDMLVPASQTVLNEATTLAALTSVQSLEQPGVLHLATHASFDNRSPESSMIHLWNEDLSMKDFSQLGWGDSDLKMLILSACSTALSGRNSELGFAGLAAAAGVDATVGSLWEVSDLGTLALMSEFYSHLERTPLRADALRDAQLTLLRGETRIEEGRLVTSHGEIELPLGWGFSGSMTLEHPFFWSAFTMVGNPW